MKRLSILITIALFATGCWNDNTLTIYNHSGEQITLVLRSVEYVVAGANGQRTISDIPNGKYEYSTVVKLPPGAKSWSPGEGISGTMEYYNNATQYSLSYGSLLQDSVYSIEATLSSTDNKAITH